jgi:inner membrane protein
MYRTGHLGGALLVYAPLGCVTALAGFTDLALTGGAVALALATAPDVDHRVPGISHRGPTHTVWFALAVGVAVGAVGAVLGAGRGPLPAVGVGLFGFVVGMTSVLSHLGADALTPMGIRPFAPLRNDHITYDLTPAKNPVANAALLALGVAATLVALATVRAFAGV